MRTLVLFVFHRECENLRIFLERGTHAIPRTDILFIYNDPHVPVGTPPRLWKKGTALPTGWGYNWSCLQRKHVNLLIRPNIGHDFEGWNTALFFPGKLPGVRSEVVPLYTLYDRFMCINSTVVGPYVPRYASSDWVSAFLSPLSETVKMVGISVNFMRYAPPGIGATLKSCYGLETGDYTHVQSMCFGFDRTALALWIRYGLFAAGKSWPRTKDQVIFQGEIGMSAILRHHKYSIYSMLAEQGVVPWNRIDPTDNVWCIPRSICLLEIMFGKNPSATSFPDRERYDRGLR